jgi:hypothetical protein
MDEKGEPLTSPELQRLWFSTLRRRWSSLAVIPAQDRTSAVSIASGLAAVGGNHGGRPVTLFTPGEADLATVERLVKNAAAKGAAGASPDGPGESARLVVALDPILSNPQGMGIALSADAALLCITLGETSIASARKTIELVGRERFIGCVVFRDA